MHVSQRWWPVVAATVLFILIILVVAPWADLPLNDDWQYAHVAKQFASTGHLVVDVNVAPSLVGQTFMAWPVIEVFGFSHVALRMMTLLLSVLILVELDFLLSLATVQAVTRFLALGFVVVNPIFLHLSTTFMTENYGYVVALLGACLWFVGRRRESPMMIICSAVICGFSFWIRQLSALVLVALVFSELTALGFSRSSLTQVLKRRGAAILLWGVVVAAYFVWARATGNYKTNFGEPLSRIASPVALIVVVQAGIFLFYMTFFLFPLVARSMTKQKLSVAAALIPVLLTVAAAFAFVVGNRTWLPMASLHSTFPFLHNVLTPHGVGPVTLTDVYVDGNPRLPSPFAIVFVAFEIVAIVVSIGWGRIFRFALRESNEVAAFGAWLAIINLVVVAVSFQVGVFDRYHYAGLIGLTLTAAAFSGRETAKSVRAVSAFWLLVLGVFSTLGVRDYFRWNEVRASLFADATRNGIAPSDIDAGYELNGWNAVEGLERAPSSGTVPWFEGSRRFRIGLGVKDGERVLMARPSGALLTNIPDLKLIER